MAEKGNPYKDEKGHYTSKENDGGACRHGGSKLSDSDFDENMNLKSGTWTERFDKNEKDRVDYIDTNKSYSPQEMLDMVTNEYSNWQTIANGNGVILKDKDTGRTYKWDRESGKVEETTEEREQELGKQAHTQELTDYISKALASGKYSGGLDDVAEQIYQDSPYSIHSGDEMYEITKKLYKQDQPKEEFDTFIKNSPNRKNANLFSNEQEARDFIEKNIADPKRKEKYNKQLDYEIQRNKQRTSGKDDFYDTYESIENDYFDDYIKERKDYYNNNKNAFDKHYENMFREGKDFKDIMSDLRANNYDDFVGDAGDYLFKLQGKVNAEKSKKEITKMLDEAKPFDEFAVGNYVIEKLMGYSPAKFRVRSIKDKDDAQSDYFAGSWGNNRKSVLNRLFPEENK